MNEKLRQLLDLKNQKVEGNELRAIALGMAEPESIQQLPPDADPLRVPIGWCRDVVFTPEEMAAYLSINQSQLDDLRRARRIPVVDLGFKTKRYHLPTVLRVLHE